MKKLILGLTLLNAFSVFATEATATKYKLVKYEASHSYNTRCGDEIEVETTQNSISVQSTTDSKTSLNFTSEDAGCEPVDADLGGTKNSCLKISPKGVSDSMTSWSAFGYINQTTSVRKSGKDSNTLFIQHSVTAIPLGLLVGDDYEYKCTYKRI